MSKPVSWHVDTDLSLCKFSFVGSNGREKAAGITKSDEAKVREVPSHMYAAVIEFECEASVMPPRMKATSPEAVYQPGCVWQWN